MATFRIPLFNITAWVWRLPNAPPASPDFIIPAQLYFNSRASFDVKPTVFTEFNPPVFLRVPIGTDIRVHDVIEAAAGDGWRYLVRFIERVHRGFTNEYFVAVLEQISGGPPPPSSGFILMESGSFILLESGDKILLE